MCKKHPFCHLYVAFFLRREYLSEQPIRLQHKLALNRYATSLFQKAFFGLLKISLTTFENFSLDF